MNLRANREVSLVYGCFVTMLESRAPAGTRAFRLATGGVARAAGERPEGRLRMIMNRTEAAEKEYMVRQEADVALNEAYERQRAAARAAQVQHDRTKARAIERCPRCSGTLETSTLRGASVARCSSCQGVWLDVGELERLLWSKPSLPQRVWHALGGRERPQAAITGDSKGDA